MYQPQLLVNNETGEIALALRTLGAELIWRLPDHVRKLQGEALKSYIGELMPLMIKELHQQKIENQRRLRKKHGKKKGQNRSAHRKDAKERNLKSVETGPAAPDYSERV